MTVERLRYEELINYLHGYRKADLETCPAAIAVINEMAGLWNKLTEEEQGDLTKISDELRTFSASIIDANP